MPNAIRTSLDSATATISDSAGCTVFINGKPAGVVGDSAGPPSMVQGSGNVLFNNKSACRAGDNDSWGVAAGPGSADVFIN